MKRADLLITEVREDTENSEFTTETGVQDSTILRAFNDAQNRIMSLIQQQKPNLFQKEKLIDAVAGQETYDLPVDVFATHMLEKVEYSPTGNDTEYYQLDYGYLKERTNTLPGVPAFYIRRSSQILIQPKPQGAGKFRLTYIRTIPTLDKRRGKVETVTLDGSTNTITTLILDPTALTTDDSQALIDAEWFCVVDRNGNIKMQGIPLADLNTSTGQITVDTFEYEDGETIAVGDYVVTGKYATTHSELPDIAERYLLMFGQWRVQKRDSSNDSVEANQEAKEMESDIMATYSEQTKDVAEIPVLDTSFMTNY